MYDEVICDYCHVCKLECYHRQPHEHTEECDNGKCKHEAYIDPKCVETVECDYE